MSRSHALTQTGILVLGLSLSFASLAQSVHEQLDPGWRQAHDMVAEVLEPEQQRGLNAVAYSAAVARLCDGFKLDEEQFMQAVKNLEHTDYASMNTEAAAQFERMLMFNYGVSVGLFLAEGSLDTDAFCEAANENRDDPEGANFWE